MVKIHERIDLLCRERGISGSKLCASLGISRSTLTELRKGRAKSLTTDTAEKIADYFAVSLDYLLGKSDEKNPPARAGEGLEENMVILSRNGKTIRRRISPEDMAFIQKMLDKLDPEEEL